MQKEFITVTPDNGTGNAEVMVECGENTSTSERSLILTIHGGGGETRTVNILQLASLPESLEFSSTDFRIDRPQIVKATSPACSKIIGVINVGTVDSGASTLISNIQIGFSKGSSVVSNWVISGDSLDSHPAKNFNLGPDDYDTCQIAFDVGYVPGLTVDVPFNIMLNGSSIPYTFSIRSV